MHYAHTWQKEPKTGSTNPPEDGQYQLSLDPAYGDGGDVHIVAASFHALHAPESPATYG